MINNAADREWLRSLLLRWQAGEITEREVHEEAEEAFEAADDWPTYSESDDRSIAVELLASLDALNVQWITRVDVPAMLEFLDTSTGRATQGWERWHQYWHGVDFEKRRQELARNPYYSAVSRR